MAGIVIQTSRWASVALYDGLVVNAPKCNPAAARTNHIDDTS
jgi:hypothetical protein